ncbi:hypothetical protein BX600DRAFT_148849 [Xylariales sp. PMI_506]|nr:hypothetical protein BX600DRAFT_148849 [Xylariales sp. PMI_506]
MSLLTQSSATTLLRVSQRVRSPAGLAVISNSTTGNQRRSLHLFQTAQDAILSVHAATGASWALLIPLLALGVNLTARLPFTLYNQRILQRRAGFISVQQAWLTKLYKDVQREHLPRDKATAKVTKAHQAVVKRMWSSLGLQNWRLYTSFLGFPFWILNIGALRRICERAKVDQVAGVSADAVAAQPTGAAAAAAAESTTTALQAAVDLTASDAAAPAAWQTLDISTLATEGMLWFPDLTAADPYCVLPFAVSAMMLVNLVPAEASQRRRFFGLRHAREDGTLVPEQEEKEAIVSSGKWRGRLGRLMVCLSLAIGPLTMQFPAALHLYWLTSSAVNYVLHRIVRWSMPIKVVVVDRCKGMDPPFIRPKIAAKSNTAAAESKVESAN